LRKLKERHVKAMVYEHISDQEALARAWADNAQREDLTPYDHVQAALRLQRSGMTNEEIGRILGDEGKPLSERSVQRYVAVALLPEPFQKALRENRLTIQQTYESGRRGVPAKKAIGQPVSKLRQYARKDRSEQPDIRVWRRRDGRIVIRGEFRPGVSDADLHVREANDYVREVLARKASDSVTDAKGQQV
jgi:ParB-like chromosome segregation protein Spo0J